MWDQAGSDLPPSDRFQDLPDGALCDAVRGGEAWPLGALWSRHHDLALAWAWKKDPALAEDVVAESFDLVFQALIKGGGPTESFKSYLFRTMNTQFGRHWKSRQHSDALEDQELEDTHTVSAADRIESEEQHDAAAAALRSLPERWQEVIVAVDIEGRSVQEVAASLGLTPNSASVLLKRAREGLRKSWLTVMHPTRDLPDECARSVSRFGELRWGKRDTPSRLEARAHIDDCDRCSSRWLQFRDQAVLVGLASAGILALSSGAHRRVTVPVAATVGVAGLALTATALFTPLFGSGSTPPPGAEQSASAPAGDPATPDPESVSGAGSAGQASGSPLGAASASASSQANGSGTHTADGRAAAGSNGESGAGAQSAGTVSASATSSDSSSGRADGLSSSAANSASNSSSDANGTSDPEPSNVLYFGDWSDWCESSQAFTPSC